MKIRPARTIAACVTLAVAAATGIAPSAQAAPANTVSRWNKIAEDTVVASGALQSEGMIYMGYASAAVYDAVVAIEGGYEPYGLAIDAPAGASVDAAIVEAAYRTLVNYFPSQATTLGTRRDAALAEIADGQAKDDGIGVGAVAAAGIIARRTGDGRLTPYATTSPVTAKPEGPGVWRRTPAAFAAPQTPWVGDVRPFILRSGDQFMPEPPPSLSSEEWAEAFDQMKRYGAADSVARTDAQTKIARFWTANVIRQYNLAVRDLADPDESGYPGLTVLETARLAAMVNVVGADALISCLRAKYHHLFWRPVTAIDPSAVTADGFGPVPGYDDGNPTTAEQPGWRPLLPTPNHPEYPAAHGVITSAMAEVFSEFLGTTKIALTIHGADAVGPLHGESTFATAQDLRAEIIDARIWGGLHYRFSGVAGIVQGRQIANYDLRNAFQPA